MSHDKTPTGLAFPSRRSPRATSPYKHGLRKGEIAGDHGLLSLLERAGTAHTRNRRHPGESRHTGTARTLVGIPSAGSLPRDSAELQRIALQPATPRPTAAPLPAGISGTTGISQGSAAVSFCSVQHRTHVGEEGTEESWLPGTSQDRAPCLWDYCRNLKYPSPGSAC